MLAWNIDLIHFMNMVAYCYSFLLMADSFNFNQHVQCALYNHNAKFYLQKCRARYEREA